jgi:hypothetical protein
MGTPILTVDRREVKIAALANVEQSSAEWQHVAGVRMADRDETIETSEDFETRS